MSTNAQIGIENEDGSIRSIYLHWDGYPSHAGKILAENYTDEDSVNALIDCGNCSVLGKSIEECTFYMRDMGYEADSEHAEHYSCVGWWKESCSAEEYCYLFTNGEWKSYKL